MKSLNNTEKCISSRFFLDRLVGVWHNSMRKRQWFLGKWRMIIGSLYGVFWFCRFITCQRRYWWIIQRLPLSPCIWITVRAICIGLVQFQHRGRGSVWVKSESCDIPGVGCLPARVFSCNILTRFNSLWYFRWRFYCVNSDWWWWLFVMISVVEGSWRGIFWNAIL